MPSWVISNINQSACQAGSPRPHRGFVDYSRGLMLPLERKSVDPGGAHGSAACEREASVADHWWAVEWSDKAVLKCVRDWVSPSWGQKEFYWIVEITDRKKGVHSVGVARQYGGSWASRTIVRWGESVVVHERAVCRSTGAVLAGEMAKDRRREKKPLCQRS